eukprot:TCONS_00000820-protein
MSLSVVFFALLLYTSLGFICAWFVLSNYNQFVVAVKSQAISLSVNNTVMSQKVTFDQTEYEIYADNTYEGILWNKIGIILLNVWTSIGHLGLLAILQLRDNTFLDKPVIFLLQQSLLMQLASFMTLNWIYKKLFLLPSGYDRWWWFSYDLFSGWWAARLFVALVMSQLLLLLLFVSFVFRLHAKAYREANNAFNIFISFG